MLEAALDHGWRTLFRSVVGQSNDVIIKNSEALFNVAGFEIENTDDADVHDNVAHCNTGGFLTFDLPGLNAVEPLPLILRQGEV